MGPVVLGLPHDGHGKEIRVGLLILCAHELKGQLTHADFSMHAAIYQGSQMRHSPIPNSSTFAYRAVVSCAIVAMRITTAPPPINLHLFECQPHDATQGPGKVSMPYAGMGVIEYDGQLID